MSSADRHFGFEAREGVTTGAKIAVLVPAHNEEDNLPLSLPGAVEQVGPENVYVVDDNSFDRTARVPYR